MRRHLSEINVPVSYHRQLFDDLFQFDTSYVPYHFSLVFFCNVIKLKNAYVTEFVSFKLNTVAMLY